jgi:peptidoglycan/LPS O-acetylase OafA/YrhL
MPAPIAAAEGKPTAFVPKYRADVDGLRGIAVLAVIWFHSGLPGLSGGFAGVDVFFVISGFLITTIIHKDAAEGRFSFAYFYQRRFRRIAPALLTVVAATLLASLFLLLPYELEELAKSAAATVAMVSNIYFWRSVDYFAPAAETVPLLHSWSLGVEEQFYLLFPAALVLAERARAPRLAVAAIGIGSLALCLFASGWFPIASFYLLPTRGWELMIGAALALGMARMPARFAEGCAALGLLLIAAAFVMIDDTDLFPGWLALLPTLGAALVIASGPGAASSRALASAPLVYVGRISYSLYLWHWPVFVFLRHWNADPVLSPALSLLGIAAATALSALTYRWIEQPARDRSTAFRRVLLPWIAVAAAILIACAIAIAGRGLHQRLPDRVNEIAGGRGNYAPLAHSCTDVGFEKALVRCSFGPQGPAQVLLWGDSHAAAISEAVAIAFKKPGLIISTGACMPTVGWTHPDFHSGYRTLCSGTNARALHLAENDPRITTVVLSAYWLETPQIAGDPFWGSVQQLVDRLNRAGKKVVVVAGVPDPGVDVPWASAIRERFGRPPLRLRCDPARVPLRGVVLVDVSSQFCDQAPHLLYSDSNHPSRHAGRSIIAPAIRRALDS